MDKHRISVIVPVYNVEKYVSECLDSILNQTLRPFEIIVCDDASTDDTREIVMEYARIYPELFKNIFHDANKGISRNYNSGLRAAKGDYVSMVAGDDYWMPEKLDSEFRALKGKNTQWVYSKVLDKWEDKGGTFEPFDRTSKGSEGLILFDVLARHVSPRNFLVEHNVLKELGFYNTSFEVYEDWDLKIRLAARYPVAYVNGENIIYRRHKTGMSKVPEQLHWRNILKVLSSNRKIIGSLSSSEINEIKKGILNKFFPEKLTLRKGMSYCLLYMKYQAMFERIKWQGKLSSAAKGFISKEQQLLV